MIHPLNIHIVEDEMIIAADLHDMLIELGYQVNGISNNYEEAVAFLTQNQTELVLLDITLSGNRTGIDLAHRLNQELQLPFIFLTSHSDKGTIQMARETKPYGYLIKPFEKDDVFASVEMAIARMNPPVPAINTVKHLFLPKGKGRVKIPAGEILFTEANGNYIIIHTSTEQFVLRKTLKEAELEFFSSKNFIRVHKSYIVNQDAIKKISSLEIILSNGKSLPVGRSYINVLKEL